MHKRILVLPVAALLAAATAVPAWAGGDRHDLAVFDPRTDVVETFLDLGDEGLSAGDTILENSSLVDPRSGEDVGRIVTRIQIVEVLAQPSEELPDGDFEFILGRTVQLDEGTLSFYGVGVHTGVEKGLSFALIGGTGEYAGVGGEVTITAAELHGAEGPLIEFRFA